MADKDPIDQLIAWAHSVDNVRALILTSTRAVPGGTVDAYSDYDVIAVVRDLAPLVEDSGWLGAFGNVLIAYWDPIATAPATAVRTVGSVVNYVDGLKIDFSLWEIGRLSTVTEGVGLEPEFDAGYRVLLDKDKLTDELPAPTYRGYVPERPDEATYHRLITDFLIGVPYVAKSLLRNELLPMKWVLDFDMRFNYLVPMLQWRIEVDHDWTLPAGNLGKGLHAHLPTELLERLETTFTGVDPDANWAALYAMINLFADVADEVGRALGHSSRRDQIEAVSAHARRMQRGDFARGPLPRH